MSDRPENFAARNCPPEDREAFFRDNAAACIEQRDAKIARQAKRLAELEHAVTALRNERDRLKADYDMACQIFTSRRDIEMKKFDTLPEVMAELMATDERELDAWRKAYEAWKAQESPLPRPKQSA